MPEPTIGPGHEPANSLKVAHLPLFCQVFKHSDGVCLALADGDAWADARGMFMAAAAAGNGAGSGQASSRNKWWRKAALSICRLVMAPPIRE
jgi:hypothetical protein